MKKLFLNLILLSAYTTSANNNVPTLPPSDHRILDALHSAYKADSSCCKKYDNKTINDYLALLAKRIPFLQHKLQPENIYQEKRNLALVGFGIMATLVGCACIEVYMYCRTHYPALLSGKFNHIDIPHSLFEKSKSERFKLKEKKYLKQFSVDHIRVEDYWELPQIEDTGYYSVWNSDYDGKDAISKLSKANKEKLNYAALRYAINNDKQGLKKHLMGNPLLWSLYGIFLGGLIFYLAYSCEGTMTEKLELDIKIHNLLNEEQQHRLSLP